jgi:succinate dehydrogenase/fumarate reductase flavoprotein subunit
MHTETDVLVIGAGGAGMYAAIELARRGCRPEKWVPVFGKDHAPARS